MNKVSKILAMCSTGAMIVFMWLTWAGRIPLYMGLSLYFTFIGIYHILSTLFYEGDRDDLRRAMKQDKENFLMFVEKRFLIKTLSTAITAVEDIRTYCKKGGVSEDDEEIKNALNTFENIIIPFYKLKEDDNAKGN